MDNPLNTYKVTIAESFAPRFHGIKNVVFSDDDYIASGTIGAVYKAYEPMEQRNPDSPPYVVKIKDPGTHVSNEKFNREYDVLAGIYNCIEEGVSAAIPAAAKGTVDGSDEPALVMPYFDNAYLLERKIDRLFAEGNHWEAEQLALKAALAYSDVMIALRKSEKTVTDRKTKDFHIRDDQITVLDWNVEGEYKAEYFEAEVGQLASLWHAFLLNRLAPSYLVPYDDTQWQRIDSHASDVENGVVSVGLRLILAAARNAAAVQLFLHDGQPSYVAVKGALEAWQVLVDAANFAESQRDEAAWEKFRRTLPEDMVNDDLINLAYADLQWRMAQKANSISHAKHWAQKRSDAQTRLKAATPVTIKTMLPGDKALLELVETEGIRAAADKARVQAADRPDLKAHKQRWAAHLDAMSVLLRAQQRVQQQFRDDLLKLGAALATPFREDNTPGLSDLETQITDLRRRLTETGEGRLQEIIAHLDQLKQEVVLRQRAERYRNGSVREQLDILSEIARDARPKYWDNETIYQTFVSEALPSKTHLEAVQAFREAAEAISTEELRDAAAALRQEAQGYRLRYPQPAAEGDELRPYLDAARAIVWFHSNTSELDAAVRLEDTLKRYAPLLENTVVQDAKNLYQLLVLDVYGVVVLTYDVLKSASESPTRKNVSQALRIRRCLATSFTLLEDDVFPAVADTDTKQESQLTDILLTRNVWQEFKSLHEKAQAANKFFTNWDELFTRPVPDFTAVDVDKLHELLGEAVSLEVCMDELGDNLTRADVEDLKKLLVAATEAGTTATGRLAEFAEMVGQYRADVKRYEGAVKTAQESYETLQEQFDNLPTSTGASQQATGTDYSGQIAKLEIDLENLDRIVKQPRTGPGDDLQKQVNELRSKIDTVTFNTFNIRRGQVDEIEKNIEALAAKIDGVQGDLFDVYLGWLESQKDTLSQLSTPILVEWLNEAVYEMQKLPEKQLTSERSLRWQRVFDAIWHVFEMKLTAAITNAKKNKNQVRCKQLEEALASMDAKREASLAIAEQRTKIGNLSVSANKQQSS